MTNCIDLRSEVVRRLLRKAVALSAIGPAVVFSIASLPTSHAQVQRIPAGQAAFEVASIRPSPGSFNRTTMRNQGGGFTVTSTTLKELLMIAYELTESQIDGARGWIGSETFEIVAKAEGMPDRIPKEQLRAMLHTLLAERFQLRSHWEMKQQVPVYRLVLGKDGHKLPLSEESGRGYSKRLGPDRKQLSLTRATTGMLANTLTSIVGRPVIDKTELTGQYDITLEWAPERAGLAQPADAGVPSIFTAVQEQLGLRLESERGASWILVIDHAQRPSEN